MRGTGPLAGWRDIWICWDTTDNKAEVEDEDDAPAPKAAKSKADKTKKPAAKAEAAPADDGECSKKCHLSQH